MSTIGERIAELRLQRGMTQSELGEAVGESKQTIYKYERGIIANIPLAKVEAIAKALRCPPAALTGWEESAAAPDDDAELMEYLEYLRTRPEVRMLMRTVKGATKEEVEENVRFIEALRKSREK